MGSLLTRLIRKNYIFSLVFIYHPWKPRTEAAKMDDDIIEFVIAQDRKYSMDHLWFQQKDQKLMIGVSEFLRVEIGDVLRVILPQAETEIDEGGSLFSLWTADEKVSLTSPFPV